MTATEIGRRVPIPSRLGQYRRRRSFRGALSRAFRAFAVRYPQLSANLFDEHFVSHHVAPMLEEADAAGEAVTPHAIAAAWAAQFYKGDPTDRWWFSEATAASAELLGLLERELRRTPAGLPAIGPRAAVVLLGVASILAALAPLQGPGVATRTTNSAVHRFDPYPATGEPVEAGWAQLRTDGRGATLHLHTADLPVGEAVTVWWLIFNHPAACAGHSGGGPCTMDDLRRDPAAVGGDLIYADGAVIDNVGTVSFTAYLQAGAEEGWFSNGLRDPLGAEIHALVRTNGQIIPGMVDEMTGSFRGGCRDGGEIAIEHPAYFEGTPGPNDCAYLQAAVFRQ